MKTSKHLPFILFVIFWLAPALVLAQADCPEIIRAALDATDEACATIGRNQACYGNITLQAEPQEGVADFTFSNPGDIVDVAGVQSLTLLPWDEAENVWGIALMKLQTNLSDTLPGQNVTFLLFGDVEIENAVETNTDPVTFEVIAQSNLNVRSGPSADNERIGGLSDGESVVAIGRNEDNSWLYIQLTDESTGWVSADFVETSGDISTLNTIDLNAEPTPAFNPMQAFYFRSGINDAPCAEAPNSGILVQTPEGVTQIQFAVNEVNISLGSTIYMQAQPDGDMIVNVVEGWASIEASVATVYAPAGTQVRVPLDANGIANGTPVGPLPYSGLSALPITVLDREIEIAESLTEDEIEEVMLALTPISGIWLETTDTCQPEDVGEIHNLNFERDENELMNGTALYVLVEPGIYRSDRRNGNYWIMRVVSPGYVELESSRGCFVTYELVSATESETTPVEVTSPGGG